MPEWYCRFGDIPGIAYNPPPHINRSRLAGHDAVPEVEVYELEGERKESLWWPTKDGGSSASPVHERAFGSASDVSTATLLRRTYEALELPGEPSDYHFLIQGCADDLWSRRREEPGVVAEVERLCWLDVRLVQARPDAVRDEYSADERFYGILAFGRLIEIYEREGFLAEALEVAELAARYGQCQDDRRRIMLRIEAVRAEAGPDEP